MKLELRSIRVKNCGPLDDVRVEFYDEQGKTLPVCVLAGANGSGKTTILELITWLTSGMLGSLPWPPKSESYEYAQLDWLVDGNDFSVIFGDIPIGISPPANHILNTRDNQWQVNGALSEKLLGKVRLQENRAMKFGGFSKPELNGSLVPSLLYFPYERSFAAVTGNQIQKEQLSYHLVRRLDAVRSFRGSLNSYLIWLDYAEPEQFKAAQEFLNELDFEGKTFQVERKTLDIIVHTRDGHEHRLHELSSGEQNLLIILMELRRRLLPHSIVLIDEIENSLHPAYQHKLAQALLKMQHMIPFQLIVTTHSWEFAEIFGASATRVLTKF